MYASYSLRMEGETVKQSVVCEFVDITYTGKCGDLTLDKNLQCSLSQTTAMTDER